MSYMEIGTAGMSIGVVHHLDGRRTWFDEPCDEALARMIKEEMAKPCLSRFSRWRRTRRINSWKYWLGIPK